RGKRREARSPGRLNVDHGQPAVQAHSSQCPLNLLSSPNNGQREAVKLRPGPDLEQHPKARRTDEGHTPKVDDDALRALPVDLVQQVPELPSDSKVELPEGTDDRYPAAISRADL